MTHTQSHTSAATRLTTTHPTPPTITPGLRVRLRRRTPFSRHVVDAVGVVVGPSISVLFGEAEGPRGPLWEIAFAQSNTDLSAHLVAGYRTLNYADELEVVDDLVGMEGIADGE